MFEQGGIFLLTYMVTVAIMSSLAFNIDTTNPNIYTGNKMDSFGYKVLQFMSGENKGILVTAPQQLNGSGGICKPNQNQIHQCFSPPAISLKDIKIPVKHFGLSLAEDSTRSQFTVCSPSVVHECDENSYLNSICYKFTDSMQQLSSFKPAFQGCIKKSVDLVFLFDGSESMSAVDFKKNKDFIVDIMNNLKNTSIKFAAAQFSSNTNMVFDFNDYVKGRALAKLEKEGHMKDLTNTHKALRYVLHNISENETAGATRDAIKVVVLITDGDPTDTNKKKIIEEYNNKSIIRFVIGVKVKSLDKLQLIASEPKENNTFLIQDYNGLTGILGNFQKKIFKTEGTKVARAGDLTNEMSQSGFSAVYHKDTLILGSVGSNSWRGSLYERHDPTGAENQIEDPDMQMDSYMGYSVSAGERNNATIYFTGAPRFNHTGQVVVFMHNGIAWFAAERINEEQIGSYFGAELCTLDVDSDSNTDFLLVGAPLFYQPQKKREGLIYIYSLTHKMKLNKEMTVSVPSLGRFGTTISNLADLNGDALRDVAVGAPLEDDHRGAVYIYLGDKHKGIRSTYSQRIMGQKIKPELRFFGQAIDGNVDLDEDGLTDIVVGSYGTATVLRSKAVFNIKASLSFHPAEINTDEVICLGNTDMILPMVTLTVCFHMEETTHRKAGVISSGLNISYTLDADPMRKTYRGLFSKTNKKDRSLTSTHEFKDEQTCFNHSVYMMKCVRDTLSPVSIKLNFSQADSGSAPGILNVDSNTQAVVEIPFKKDCRKNDTCVAELDVDFRFSTPTLLVVHQDYFYVYVKLANHGDDSYNTMLTLHYPAGLSFSKMTLIEEESTRSTLHKCNDLEGVMDKTICGISLPVYRSGAVATFKLSFLINNSWADWNDTMSMTVSAQSDNGNSTTASKTKIIPVQFQIDLAATVREDTITYMNFTSEDNAPKTISAIHKIANLGFKAFPITASLTFPTNLDHDFELKNYHVSVHQNKTQCTEITAVTSDYCSTEKNCKSISCDPLLLDSSSAEFILSGEAEFRDLEQQAANLPFLKRYTGDRAEVHFKSFIHVRYDKQRYVQASRKQEETSMWKNDPTMQWTDIRIELIILPDKFLIILTGAGLGLLLLIIIAVVMSKLGCFKRKTLQYYQEQDEKLSIQPSTPTQSNPALTKTLDNQTDKSDQTAEAKPLLDESEKTNEHNLTANTEEEPDKPESTAIIMS